jgi:hypothetical protein
MRRRGRLVWGLNLPQLITTVFNLLTLAILAAWMLRGCP